MTDAERQQEDFPKCSKCGSAIWVEHSADCPAVVETKPTNGDIKALQARAEAAEGRLQALQDFCAKERGLHELRRSGGQSVGYSPRVSPSVLKELEQIASLTQPGAAGQEE